MIPIIKYAIKPAIVICATFLMLGIGIIIGVWIADRDSKGSWPEPQKSDTQEISRMQDGTQEVTPQADRYVFTLYVSEQNDLILQMKTKIDYPCRNYWIEATEEVSDDSVVVTIIGVRYPVHSPCLTALGPAILYAKNNPSLYAAGGRNLGSVRSFELVVKLGEAEDAYRVSYEGGTISVSPYGEFSEHYTEHGY